MAAKKASLEIDGPRDDDHPGSKDPGNANAVEQATPSQEDTAGEPPGKAALSPHVRNRRRRNRLLALAFLLTVVFILTVLTKQGVFDRNRSDGVPRIVPAVLFDQLCKETRKDQDPTLHVTDFEVNDAMVQQLADIECIETLIFDQGVVTDEAIKIISELPKLQHLRLRLSPIGDEGLKMLANTETLWYLNLPHAACTNEGVGALAALPRLRQLRLGSGNLGNGVGREVASITSLRGIHLIGVKVTDEGLKMLAKMPHLESLYLDDSAVTEAGWDWLFREHPHLHVHINQSHHDRDPNLHTHH